MSAKPNNAQLPPGADSSFRDSPLEHVRTLLVRFLQGLFWAAPKGVYHWSPGDDSELYISDENAIHAAEVGARPAITVTRGPVQFYSLGMDDMLEYDPTTGTKKKSVLIPGTLTMNCCSRVALECDHLAWIAAEQLWLHRELLMREGFFEIGRMLGVGSPSPAGSIVVNDGGDEWYVTSVSVPIQFYRTSQTSPLNTGVVRNITASIQAALRTQNADCGPAATSNGGLPYQYGGCPPASFAPQASDVNGNTPNPGNSAPQLPRVPHPLNPSQLVYVKTVRPYCGALRPPVRGRSVPIQTPVVEESCGDETNEHVTATSTVKV